MKTVVVYKSLSGFTRKYAEWISEKLKCDLFPQSEIKLKQLLSYDTIIYGGPLHAAGIAGYKLIRNNLEKLTDKKIIVFACGASPSDSKVLNDITAKNFSESEQISFFYLRGGFDYRRLDFKNKFLMSILKLVLKTKKELTEDEKGMLDSYENPVDFTDKDAINEIINEASY